MNIEQAFKALDEGKKITHRLFTPDEWMKRTGELYEFEDGCLCEPYQFWQYRADDNWKNGWDIYDKENR